MSDATPVAGFACPDLTSFCRLDELGLEVTGQLLEPGRAVLACRVVEPDQCCRRCGCEGLARDTVTRALAHEPFGWRPTTLLVTIRRQPRWVYATAVALSAVMVLAWVTYWFLWGEAFDYADTYRPVPVALDRASNIAIAGCFMSSVLVAALGASRLVVAWNSRGNPGRVPSPLTPACHRHDGRQRIAREGLASL